MKAILMAALVAAPASAATVEINPPAEGSVTVEQGLAAWQRVYDVASHPRCANCHTGESDRPMWSGPSFDRTRVHGMNIRAGESRIGAEYIQCTTCHAPTNEVRADANPLPHAAPRVAMDWRLAPVEADWFGRSSEFVCAQLRDPERNDGRDYLALAKHLDHDLILHWAWNPGGDREPAPYSLQEHVDDVLTWGVAGYPCPQD